MLCDGNAELRMRFLLATTLISAFPTSMFSVPCNALCTKALASLHPNPIPHEKSPCSLFPCCTGCNASCHNRSTGGLQHPLKTFDEKAAICPSLFCTCCNDAWCIECMYVAHLHSVCGFSQIQQVRPSMHSLHLRWEIIFCHIAFVKSVDGLSLLQMQHARTWFATQPRHTL
jgi:hypothetical protein